MSHKASFTNSPLATGLTPIHRLAASVQDYLLFPDPYPLYVMMAALAASYAAGRPVWLILVGPPSCGKSELLNSLLALPSMVESGAISSLGALLSGSRKRERDQKSTGGVMRRIGEHGTLVMKEFGSMLSIRRDTLREILGAFREIHDGRWTRLIGTDGGRTETWSGRMGFIAAATDAVWLHHEELAELGERFMYWSIDSPDDDGRAECEYALSQPPMSGREMTEKLQNLVFRFAVETGLDWSTPPDFEPLAAPERRRISALAHLAARARAATSRHDYTQEIVQTGRPERPTRFGLALGEMLQALRWCGVDDADNWRIVRKLAFDSIPDLRRSCLVSILSGHRRFPEILESAMVSPSYAKRALEELRHRGLIEPDGSSWRQTAWTDALLTEARIFGRNRSSRVRSHSS